MSETQASRPPFGRYPVSRLYSVAHLFPQRARCGVYVLAFGNSDRYVGQTVNVVTRFAAHRRTWADIEFLEFCRWPRIGLDSFEREVIDDQRRQGYRLRNITHALGPVGTSDLDPTVTPVEQRAWLNDEDPDPVDVAERSDDPQQRLRYRATYERLRRQPVFPQVVGILNDYVQATVAKPRETERTFWSLSCLPSTNRGVRLATLSINKMETLWLWTDGDVVGGCVNVSFSALTQTAGRLARLERRFKELEFRDVSYEAAGGDAVNITFVDPAGYTRMITKIPGFAHAARTLNLMLMRKGATLHWRSHCYDLADWTLRESITEYGHLVSYWTYAHLS